jgi:hypothetical protein
VAGYVRRDSQLSRFRACILAAGVAAIVYRYFGTTYGKQCRHSNTNCLISLASSTSEHRIA